MALRHFFSTSPPPLSQELADGGHTKEMVTSPTTALEPFSFLLGNNAVPQASSAGGHWSLGDLVPADRVLGFCLELRKSK